MVTSLIDNDLDLLNRTALSESNGIGGIKRSAVKALVKTCAELLTEDAFCSYFDKFNGSTSLR